MKAIASIDRVVAHLRSMVGFLPWRGIGLRHMAREARGSRGRLVFFALCLAVGVAAIVAVAGLSEGLDRGIRTQARSLLAADLVVRGRRPIPPEVDAVLAKVPGARTTKVKEIITVASVPREVGADKGEGPGEGIGSSSAAGKGVPAEGDTRPGEGDDRSGEGRSAAPSPGTSALKSLLIEVKAVEGEFPFYGALALTPARPLASLLAPDSAVVAPEVLARFSIRAGDRIRIGDAAFRIAGTVESEPDRLTAGFAFGPRVFLSWEGLARTRLEGFGGRVENRSLIALDERSGRVEDVAAAVKASLAHPEWFEVQTFSEAQPALRDGLRQAWRFLGLGALLSLLIGGIGVAQTVRAWLASRMDGIAVLKCLGMRPREILALYVGQTALLGLAGSLAGALLGVLVELVVPRLLGGFVQSFASGAWHPWAIARGLGLGIGVSVVFALPPLAAILRVPPARALRRDAEPLPASRSVRAASVLAVAAGVLVTAAVQSRSVAWGAAFTAGLGAAWGILALAAVLVVRVARRVPRRFVRVSLRHGLAALGRPGSGTLASIVALGLGVLVVLSMDLVQRHVTDRLRADLPEASPTAFFVGVQPAQWPGVRGLLEREGASHVDSVPIVTARLTSVDGKSVKDLAGDRGTRGRARDRGGDGARDPDGDRARRWALTREQRLTYLRALPPSSTIVEGSLWSDPSRPEASLEKDFATDLGAKLGSSIVFDVQGVPVSVVVTSLRTVAWETFGINFFIVVEPGVLDDAPQQRVAAARLPAGREQDTQDLLAAGYPNVVMIRIRDVLDRIVAILERVGLGVRILGGFTVLAGIAILAGSIGAGSIRRGREVALLKTLGMTRPGILAAFAVEYALTGLVAGVIGAVAAGVLSWTVLTRGMEIPWRFHPVDFTVAIAGAAVLSVLAGTAASLRALARRPIEVLRDEL